jgi:phasin family protein
MDTYPYASQPAEAAQSAGDAAAGDAAAGVIAGVGAGFEAMNGKMSDMMEQMMKTMSDVTEFAKGNVDALMASAKAAQAGAEALTSTLVEVSKKRFEDAQAAMKAMTSAKSPNELVQLQNDFAKAQFDQAVSAWSHMSETLLKLAGDVVQPLSSRMAVATEAMKKTVGNA